MIMYPIDKLVTDLTVEEGYRAHAYRCTSNAITVGVGRNIDQDAGGLGISEDEAQYMLKNDITRCIKELENLDWFNQLDTKRQGVIIHLNFWIGTPRMLMFKNMIAALESEDFETAAAELLDSKLARDIPGRANRLADEMRS
tara:strand:- start:583 stop:1008 length:426 start_codon:yes stop_codon:yes gene_type:complete